LQLKINIFSSLIKKRATALLVIIYLALVKVFFHEKGDYFCRYLDECVSAYLAKGTFGR